MKTNLSLLALLFLLTSCAAIAPGSDPVVVETERIESIALDTFDAFLRIEFANHDELLQVNSDIAHFANIIRAQAESWLAEVNAAKAAYKALKNPENKAQLQTALSFLKEKLRQSDASLVSAREGITTQ